MDCVRRRPKFDGTSSIPMLACHPRDIVDHIPDQARFSKSTAKMSKESIGQVWQTCFVTASSG